MPRDAVDHAGLASQGDPIGRRAFLGGLSVIGVARHVQETPRMYGLIGKITATPGNRDALTAILLDVSAAGMPGCLSYVVAHDPASEDAIWVTEVWDSEASHTGSLGLPAVQQSIARARPLIGGFSDRVVTRPLGGAGLASRG